MTRFPINRETALKVALANSLLSRFLLLCLPARAGGFPPELCHPAANFCVTLAKYPASVALRPSPFLP